MWFRRRRRHPPPVLLPPLERLAELVDRVVTLLDQAPTPAPAEHVAAGPAQQAAPEESWEEAPVGAEHVLFVPGPAGYTLLRRDGPAPARADVVELDDVRYRVLRLGPSPLPGDRGRCAFLEQERLVENRTPTGARGEPDRGHASGDPG
jgi:hypothetical protein